MGYGREGRTTYHGESAYRYRDGASVAKTFDNAQCAHVWRQGVQSFGRSSNGNLFFHHARLYSYGRHFIAAILTPDGRAFVASDSPTVSTSGHLSDAMRALGWGSNFIRLPDLTELVEKTPFGLWCDYHMRAAGGDKVDSKNLESLKRGARVALLEYVTRNAYRLEHDGQGVAMLALVGEPDAPTRFAKMLEGSKRKQENIAAEKERNRRDSYLRRASSIATMTPEQRVEFIAENMPSHPTSSEDSIRKLRKELHRARGYAKAAKRTKQAAAVWDCMKAIDSALAMKQTRLGRWQARRGLKNALEQFRLGMARIQRGGVYPDGPWDSSWRAESFVQSVEYVAREVKTLRSEQRKNLETAAQLLRQGFNAWRAEEIAESEARERKRKAEEFAKRADARRAWLAGEHVLPHLIHGLADETGGALLRAVGVTRDESGAINGGTLETSQRASVPLPHAIRAFRFLKRCKESGRDWHKNGHAIRVGHFQIDSIDAAGNFRAGCHVINWGEVERLATLLGVFEVASDDSALEPSHVAA